MLEALKYEDMLEDMKERYEDNRKTIGILIARPTSKLVQEEILNSLNYYHHRSGENIDFFLPGYGAYWHGSYPDEEQVCKIDGTIWSFSTKEFSEFIYEMSRQSKWKYKGEAELILVDYYNGKIDFSQSVIIWLDQALRDGAIESVASFLERIFELYVKRRDTFGASDLLTLNSLGQAINEELKSQFWIYRIFNRAKYFCVKNFSK